MPTIDGSIIKTKLPMRSVVFNFRFIAATVLLNWKSRSGFPAAQAFVTNVRPGKRLNFHSLASPFGVSQTSTSRITVSHPRVWIEEAEDGFVDEEENLEPGEICLRTIKSYASGSSDRAVEDDSSAPSIRVAFDVCEEQEHRRFLSAGALVRRPPNDWGSVRNNKNNTLCVSTEICDAWIADSNLQEGGPNLQLRGALLVLDDLFQYHLQRERAKFQATLSIGKNDTDYNVTNNKANDSWAIHALRNFVVHCGEEEELAVNSEERPWRSTSHVVASRMAASMRGFVPLKELSSKTSIYDAKYYDGDTSGLVLDPYVGLELYQKIRTEAEAGAKESISDMLPSEETIARYTTKRFTINRQQGE